MNNVKPLGNFDQYQMDNMAFDVEKQAFRMTVVDGITLNAEAINLPELKLPEQKTLEVPVIIKETEIHQINVPVIVKEIQKVEVPVIIKEVEYKTIEVPVVIREIQVIEVEKPVIVKEIEIKVIEKTVPVMPGYFKVCMIIQTALYFALLLTNILKKG
jgi:hypothetical protein